MKKEMVILTIIKKHSVKSSVVTRDIPAKEVWAGNPAKFVKKI